MATEEAMSCELPNGVVTVPPLPKVGSRSPAAASKIGAGGCESSDGFVARSADPAAREFDSQSAPKASITTMPSDSQAPFRWILPLAWRRNGDRERADSDRWWLFERELGVFSNMILLNSFDLTAHTPHSSAYAMIRTDPGIRPRS